LSRSCNLASFSPCLTGPVDYPFAFRQKGPGFKSPGGYLCKTGILLLALSRCTVIIFMIRVHLCSQPCRVNRNHSVFPHNILVYATWTRVLCHDLDYIFVCLVDVLLYFRKNGIIADMIRLSPPVGTKFSHFCRISLNVPRYYTRILIYIYIYICRNAFCYHL
jgi:hypothetical protein